MLPPAIMFPRLPVPNRIIPPSSSPITGEVGDDSDPATSIQTGALDSNLVINEEYLRLPGDMATRTKWYAESVGRWLVAKASTKLLWSTLFMKYRETVTPEGKVPSEKYIECCIEADASYRSSVAYRDECEVDKLKMAGEVAAIEYKSESLVGIGANIRKEMEHQDMTMKFRDR